MARFFDLWIRILIIPLILCSSTEGNVITREMACSNEKAENFVKSLVANATLLLPNPVPLPKQSDFVILSEGTVNGLSSLRPDHTTTISCRDKEVQIKTHLKVADFIVADYKWLRNLLTRTLDGDVHMKANKFEAFIQINQVSGEAKNDTQLWVATCYVTVMEEIDIDVTGQEYITWPIEKITGPAKKMFENVVHNTVKEMFKEALTSQLKDTTLAVKI